MTSNKEKYVQTSEKPANGGTRSFPLKPLVVYLRHRKDSGLAFPTCKESFEGNEQEQV